MISKSYTTFLVALVITAIGLAGVTFGLTQIELLAPYSNFAWISLLFFTILTAIVYAMYDKGALAKSNAVFMSMVFGAFGVKMMVSVIFLIIYFFAAGRPALWFVLPFFLHYMVYTALETIFVVKKLNKNKDIWKEQKESEAG